MDSLRTAPRAIDLITIADTDLICGLLEHNERNVRVAATRLLGEMPDDEQVIRSLQENLATLKGNASRELEVAETAQALARHTRRSEAVRKELLKLVSDHVPRNATFGNKSEQQHFLALLTICESLGGQYDNNLANKLLALAEDYRTPEPIRRQAMRAYGRVCEPSANCVDALIRLLGRNDTKLAESVSAACLSVVNHCKRKVDHVRRVYPKLDLLKERLQRAWQREVIASAANIDLSGARDIRDAILGIEDIVAQYGEFAERVQVR